MLGFLIQSKIECTYFHFKKSILNREIGLPVAHNLDDKKICFEIQFMLKASFCFYIVHCTKSRVTATKSS